MEEIKNAYQQKPDVVALTHVHDVKAWLGDHVPSIHDHLKAHQFKLQKDNQGVVKLFYKEWSTDNYWLPPSGMYILMQNSLGKNTPCGQPELVNINFDAAKIEKLETTTIKIVWLS